MQTNYSKLMGLFLPLIRIYLTIRYILIKDMRGVIMAQVKTQTLSLGNHWNSFIDSHVVQGRYASASEMVREGLRLLEEKEASSKLEALRAALIKGEKSGDAGLLDMEAIRQEAKKEVGLS